MKHDPEPSAASPLIALHFAGERHSALLLNLTATKARVRLIRQQQLKAGGLVALSIADLPSFPGNIVALNDDEIEVHFRSALHSSVVDEIKKQSFQLNSDAA